MKQSIAPILKQSIRQASFQRLKVKEPSALSDYQAWWLAQNITEADPVQAVRFHLLIEFMILSAALLTDIILGVLIYPSSFTRNQ